MARAVFLDRDGVINGVVLRGGRPGSPRLLSEFEIDAGVSPPLERLRDAGFRLFVITNQPDIARGLLRPPILEQMNQQMLAQLPVEAVLVCPHDDGDGCGCRKPQPGMLHKLAESEHFDLGQCFMIGDSWRDMGAARAAGCTAIILDRNYNHTEDAEFRVRNLDESVQHIIKSINQE